MVEQPGPWGHDALAESGFPVEIGTRLRHLGRELGIRVLLIKRRERLVGPRKCFLAYTGLRERRLASFDVEDAANLLELDLPSMAERRFDGDGDPVEGPLFLVCTHGKHDQCCARYGAPLFRALSPLPEAWECTHIGGDRFAGNLVCFPHGLYFGRVAPGEAVGIAEAYSHGEIDLDRYRGRSAYPPAAQAAEEAIRRRHGLTGVDDLEASRHILDGDLHLIEFLGPGGSRLSAEVRVGRLDPRLLTCKANRPHLPRSFEVRVLETVED